MRKPFIAAVALACAFVVFAPAAASGPVIDPPGQPRRLSTMLADGAEVTGFALSPTGSHVFYTTRGVAEASRWIAPIDGGPPVALSPTGSCTCWFVPRSGLFVERLGGSGEFRVLDPDTGAEVWRVLGAASAATRDGRHIVYRDGDVIASLDLDDGSSVELATGEDFSVAFDSAPPHVAERVTGSNVLLRRSLIEVIDGVRHIVGEEVWTVPAEGGALELLAGGEGSRVRGLFSTRDEVVVVMGDAGPGSTVLVLAAGAHTVLASGVVPLTDPRGVEVTSDRDWLVVEFSGGVVAANLSAGTLQTLATLLHHRGRHWLIPDGSGVLVTGAEASLHPTYDDATQFVYRIPLDGGEPVQVTENRPEHEDRTHWIVGITPDSRWLVFLDRSNYEAVLSRVRPAGGPRIEIADEEFDEYFSVPLLSADGKRLAFVSGEGNPTFVMSAPTLGGTIVNLISDTRGSVIDRLAITPDSKRVVFIARYTPNARELWVVDLGYRCGGRLATLVGTPGDDVIVGSPGPDVIVGLGGDDLLRGRARRDVICGGSGDDVLIGNAGRDILRGDGGNDVLWGGGGDDRLVGGGGADALYGGPGVDTCLADSLDVVGACELES